MTREEGLYRASPSPSREYITETTHLFCAGMIGTLHAVLDINRGGIDDMELQQLNTLDDHDPAIRIREQSRGELEDAVSRNLSFFYKRAYRYVGDPHDAEDAVQDAFLSAYKHLDQFKGTAKMTTWLTSIVTNSALSKLRRRPRHPHISMEEKIGDAQEHCVCDTLADIGPSPEDECVKSDLRRHIKQYVTELSPALRKAIELRDLEGMTMSEGARILGVAEGTFKSQVSRARSKLKRMIRGGTRTRCA